MSSVTCTISKDVLDDVKKCRLDDPNANMLAYIAKIDTDKKAVVKDAQFNNIAFEDLAEELPENEPRYVVLSYRQTHKDGRVSYPLVFIYYLPTTAKPVHRMLYASTQPLFSKETRLSDPYLLIESEDLSQEWLEGHLNKFSS
ncbi:hypothetical protein H4R22_003661 [Coemansia sp. RSA 1290]|nr:hypothetical protein BX667DRAFT_514101 [Coemansia mojavensis]KAJ2628838.1 hypothetical protein H4R22_003661 [Coemansia sp. RSA 1290]KAJ2646064.1 hypothetical protein IWW40_005675 [Coemansia sp. RSA 1250]